MMRVQRFLLLYMSKNVEYWCLFLGCGRCSPSVDMCGVEGKRQSL